MDFRKSDGVLASVMVTVGDARRARRSVQDDGWQGHAAEITTAGKSARAEKNRLRQILCRRVSSTFVGSFALSRTHARSCSSTPTPCIPPETRAMAGQTACFRVQGMVPAFRPRVGGGKVRTSFGKSRVHQVTTRTATLVPATGSGDSKTAFNLEDVATPFIANKNSLNEGIASFYDESSGLWEDQWGEHMHHGT
jgi:hypothetical protein